MSCNPHEMPDCLVQHSYSHRLQRASECYIARNVLAVGAGGEEYRPRAHRYDWDGIKLDSTERRECCDNVRASSHENYFGEWRHAQSYKHVGKLYNVNPKLLRKRVIALKTLMVIEGSYPTEENPILVFPEVK